MHLKCTDGATDHLNHYWLHNSSNVVIDGSRVQDFDNGSLIVRRISFRDGGDYECIYTTDNPLQGVLITSYTVKVTHAPPRPSIKLQSVNLVITPETQTVIAGSTAVISCEAHYDDGLLETVWQRGDKVVSQNSVLVIPRAAVVDGGEYVCAVVDTELKNSTFLTVHGVCCSSASIQNVVWQMGGCRTKAHCNLQCMYTLQSTSPNYSIRRADSQDSNEILCWKPLLYSLVMDCSVQCMGANTGGLLYTHIDNVILSIFIRHIVL